MNGGDLKYWREEKGVTQEELANLLGVTKPCISQWESGKRKIPPFLHIALKCLKVKKGGKKIKGKKKERRKNS